MTNHAEFDEYAENYDAALDRGISLSGEDKVYFARRRMEWLRLCLQDLTERPLRAMDFGCGSGAATPLFFEILGVNYVLGVDTSAKSLDVARRQFGSERTEFQTPDQHRQSGMIDLVYCNGVFHHIPPTDRAIALGRIWDSLSPGGFFALWENNPLNPGTRIVMSRIPFDRDAITLTAREARQLLRAGGFKILRTDHLFIFPRALRLLRAIEPKFSSFPFGAQYQVLCQKPSLTGAENLPRKRESR